MIDWLKGRKTFSSLLSGFCIIGLIIIIPGLIVETLTKKTTAEMFTLREKINSHNMTLIQTKRDFDQLQIQLLEVSLKKSTAAYNHFTIEAEQLFQNVKNQIDTSIKKHDKHGERELSALLTKLNMQFEQYYKLTNEVANFYIENIPQVSGETLETFYQKRQQISLTMETLFSEYLKELDKSFLSITENSEKVSNTILVTALFLIIAIILLSFSISHLLNSTIVKACKYTELIAKGDLSAKPEIEYSNEIGKLIKSIAAINRSINETVNAVNQESNFCLSCSSEVSDLSIQLSNSTSQAATQMKSIAGLSEDVNSLLQSMLEEIDSTARKFKNTVLTATETTTKITELSQKSQQASSLAIQASEKTRCASTIVEELDQATQEIGVMAETITEISEKTNLLALNATIEAARAGEAGKGFSVVANEVKELARQTAQATIEIQNRISSVKESTERTLFEIHDVNRVIHDANTISQEVMIAIQEQSQVTDEIVQNITHTSLEIDEVSKRTSEITDTTTQVTTDLKEVSLVLTGIIETNDRVTNKSNEIRKVLRDSKGFLAKFKI